MLTVRYAGGESGARKAARRGALVVVVDAFRASTSISILVSRGARVIPVASVAEAAAFEADFRVGERGSAKVPGFDFGNSPTELLDARMPPGSTVAFSTTNGTRITEAAAGAPVILTGAFVNAGAVADRLLAEANARGIREAVVVGCGWQGKRASEDEVAAGAIIHRLAADATALDERARRVVSRYLGGSRETLRDNRAARRLKRLGYEKDLSLCLTEDAVPIAPRLVDGAFVGE